jgi:hypothetical protein
MTTFVFIHGAGDVAGTGTWRRPSSASGATGTVALAQAWARWTHTLSRVSDNESQFSERVG